MDRGEMARLALGACTLARPGPGHMRHGGAFRVPTHYRLPYAYSGVRARDLSYDVAHVDVP